MDRGDLLAALEILIHWRVVLVAASAFALALMAGHLFPWFVAMQGIAFCSLACGVGVLWQSQAITPQAVRPTTTTPTKPSTFAVAATLLGLFWGAASSANLHAIVAGLLPLPLALWSWIRFAQTQPQLKSTSYPIRCVALTVTGYALAAGLRTLLR